MKWSDHTLGYTYILGLDYGDAFNIVTCCSMNQWINIPKIRLIW